MYKACDDTEGRPTAKAKPKNLCKGLPKSMVKYINMQTCLCSQCKFKGIISRCSSKHLGSDHGIHIETPEGLIERIRRLNKEKKALKDFDKDLTKRRRKLEIANTYIVRNIEKSRV